MRSSRRRLLGILGGALAAALSGAPLGQPGSRGPYYRIGVIAGESRFTRELVEGLRELGYEEGRHYALAVRSHGAEGARLGALADELIALQPDVIVASAAGPAAALKSRTRRIPIVMASALDPVGDGLVSSLAQPGGNLTGMTMLNAALHARLVELAAVLLPRAKRMAFLANPERSLAQTHRAEAARAARALGLELAVLPARAGRELESLEESLAKMRADALIVPADALFFAQRERLVKAALAAGVPAIAALQEFAAAGALATYGPDPAENWRRSARYVERILKGASPAELPIGQPARLELVVNLKTAKALRIAIPQAVLLRADRVVE
jgi:putative ABC transport system substrate-binding protein